MLYDTRVGVDGPVEDGADRGATRRCRTVRERAPEERERAPHRDAKASRKAFATAVGERGGILWAAIGASP
jgi:hypothetical protein